MTETIFTADQPATPPEAPIVSTPVIPPELAEYVGAGKKYQSIEDVHKAFPHAQKHINTLEEELAQLKEELTKRKTTEELLTDIQTGFQQSVTTTTPSVKNDQDISAIVRQELEREKIVSTAKNNVTRVANVFRDSFGDKAEEIYNKIAAESNLSVATMNQLAATSPEAVLKLAGLTSQKPTNAGKLSSDVNIQNNNKTSEELSAKTPLYASSKDDTAAIARAREYVLKQHNM